MTPNPRHRTKVELADMVHELTSRHEHSEHYTIRKGKTWYGRNHVTKVPSLLDQLWENDTPSQSAEDGPRPGFGSRPAARLDALAIGMLIDTEVHGWLVELEAKPKSIFTADLVLQLHGLSASADPLARREISKSIRRWWTQARIVTGWDSPAWTPDNTCPQCGLRGTLKIRLAERIGMCIDRGDDETGREACGATWDETTIGLLADHIRIESALQLRSKPGAGPCWCPWPRPDVPDLEFLCRGCGSARCRHALTSRLLADLRAERRLGA